MKRVYSLDCLKFIASIFIVLLHYQQLLGFVPDTGIRFYLSKFDFGLLVEFFFLLSGLLMVGYVDKIRDGMCFENFFARRYVRLVPLMCMSVIAYEGLIKVLDVFLGERFVWMFPTKVNIWGTIISSLGIQAGWVFPTPSINNPIWYVSVLLLCYIFFFIIVKLCATKNINVWWAFIGFILLAIGIRTYGITLPFFNSTTVRGFIPFFFGVLFGKYINGRDSKRGELIASIGIIGFLSSCMVLDFEILGNDIGYLLTFVYYPAIIIIFNNAFLKKIFSCKIFETLGKISYSVYIWHVDLILVLLVFVKVIGLDINLYSNMSMVVFVIICVLIGFVSHYLIEKPVDKFLKKRLKWTK